MQLNSIRQQTCGQCPQKLFHSGKGSISKMLVDEMLLFIVLLGYLKH